MTRGVRAAVGVAVAAVGLAAPGCAARRHAARAAASDLAAGETLLREGCYRCLEEALATFEKLGAWPGARERAFDAAALLALRERELGLRALDHLPRARDLAAQGERSRQVLRVIESLPWPVAACGAAEREAALLRFGHRAVEAAGARAALAALLTTDLLTEYLRATIDCTWPESLPEPGAVTGRGSREVTSDPPLLRFRRLWCGGADPADFEALRRDVPRFAEVDLALGDAALGGGALLTGEDHYAAVFAALPAMLPAALGLARVHVMLEEYESSLSEYDAVLQTVPDQQDALLGKARALSGLGRHREALPLLDRLIELGTWLLGDAFYWRGWNRLQLGEVQAASEDADRALRLMVNARVHALAGHAAMARQDLDRAAREFESAFALDDTDCDIPLSLATVRGQQRRWADSAPQFERAAACLVEARARYARRLDEIARADLSPARRARLEGRTRASMDSAHAQEGLARFNVAVGLANAGRRAEAVPWARQAAGWPAWAARAAAMLRDLQP